MVVENAPKMCWTSTLSFATLLRLVNQEVLHLQHSVFCLSSAAEAAEAGRVDWTGCATEG